MSCLANDELRCACHTCRPRGLSSTDKPVLVSAGRLSHSWIRKHQKSHEQCRLLGRVHDVSMCAATLVRATICFWNSAWKKGGSCAVLARLVPGGCIVVQWMRFLDCCLVIGAEPVRETGTQRLAFRPPRLTGRRRGLSPCLVASGVSKPPPEVFEFRCGHRFELSKGLAGGSRQPSTPCRMPRRLADWLLRSR